MQKEFDLVIYGATGFTGRLAAQYMMREGRGDRLRVAIAGRDAKKLEQVQQACIIKPVILIADSSQPDTIDDMVRRTKVVLSFAGPFSLYGEPVIAACAKLGVDYLDITGETPFIHDMIQKYQAQAVATGARLIPFSGFDSVPADLMVFIAENAARKHHVRFDKLYLYYQIRGGFNGGTLASALHMAELADKQVLRNPNCLIPDESWQPLSPSRFKPHYEPVLKRWTAPFLMDAINKAVVRRSAWLREQEGEHTHAFHYEERLVMSKRFGYVKAWLTTGFLFAFHLLSSNSIGRKLLKYLGPKPGEGPSTEQRQKGFFRGRLVCYDQNSGKLIVSMERAGDPGNEITVALACESALLAVENAFVSHRKGFLTPSTAFDEQLVNKLVSTGSTINTQFQ